jgi:kynurenine formamidase
MCAPVATGHHHHPPPADRSGVLCSRRAQRHRPAFPKRARRLVDLTHRLVRTFPSFFGPPAVSDEVINDFATTGFFSKRWTLEEHVGTHLDTPGHFDEGNRLIDEIGPDELVAPIVVIDITAKAAADPNAVVTPEDLVAFERRYGRIPERALVCMDSGWSAKVDDGDAFRGGGGFPDLNFPGFSLDATEWLADRRDPVGIGVDTLSLDPGDSADFAVHSEFLGTGRYGIESLAHLDQIPPRGALAFVGPVPWEGGSGAPCRVIATW